MADSGSGPLGWVRELLGSVRVRTTVAAVAVVGAALVISSVAMVVLLRRSLTSDVRSSAVLQAEAVVDELTSGSPEEEVEFGDAEEEYVQIVDRDGTVVASSANVAGQPVLVNVRPGDARRIDGLPFEDDPFLAVAVSARRGGLTVIAGRTLETVIEATQTVSGLLAAGVPLLLLVAALVAWRVVGRALAPVESIRSEVEAISTKELHRRVPVPAGKDEIARLAATMNGMLSRLDAGQAQQRRFVSDASHELRSPVTTIRQHAEVALSHPDGTSIEELAEVVLAEDIRLQRLVEDLLLLTMMDEGTLRLRTESVDLDDLLFEEANRLRRSMRLRIDVGGVSAGRVSGDAAQLKRLVRNLADNAARHATGTVSMTLREEHETIVLAVDDDGRGILSSDRERVFERFVRLDEARARDSGGSGLGLAIVAEIAGAHGAKVAALESHLGGARFEVRFPAQSSG